MFAISPTLWMFRKQIDSAIVRACADDIGAAIRKLDHLPIIHRIFDKYTKASSSFLNQPNVWLVLLCARMMPPVLAPSKSGSVKNIPEWVNMKIQTHAKYLGLFLGPSAGSVQ